MGVTIDPFVTPVSSEGFPRMESTGWGARAVTVKDTKTPFQEAVSGMVWVVVAEALAAKVALVAPAAIVTAAGIERTALPPDRATAAPPAGAALVKVTVQVAELPLGTFAGLQERLVNCVGASSETEADWVTVLAEAVIAAG